MTQILHPRLLEIIACPRCLARLSHRAGRTATLGGKSRAVKRN